MLPDTCPTCHAVPRIDSRYLPTLDVRVRVYDCGCALGAGTNAVYTTIACPRTADVLAQLRADNVRLGDRNVLLATELQAIADTAREGLGVWATAPLAAFGYLLDLKALRTILDLATEALEGAAPAPAAEAPHEPGPGSAVLSVSAESASGAA